MLEQSALHGRTFRSNIAGKTLVSKPVAVGEIMFGPMRPVQIYRISDREMWVQDKNKGTWYHYGGSYGEQYLTLLDKQDTVQITKYTADKGFFYYYGLALCNTGTGKKDEEKEQIYFIQNEPCVTYNKTPDIGKMQMPLTMQALDYNHVFSYPEKVKQLLSNVPASYVDRYKRPVNRRHGRTFPIPMETVTTTWTDLPDTTYPVGLNFGRTVFGIVDLEPSHTKDDLDHFESLPGYYEEETPRGGKHKIVRIDEKTFKFRYSPGLEIINQSQVTLYGINAKWLDDEPPVLDTSVYNTVGHEEHQIVARLERPDVEEEVALLKAKAEENLSTAAMVAAKLYRADPDDSHGEYMVLYTLWKDIRPYARQFETEKLPWILEAYAQTVLSHRDKHETLRNGLPYLVYLADIIISKEVTKIWKNQNCTSLE